MLENVNLKLKLSREEYSQALPKLQRRLNDLEKACWDHKVASMVVFEGWDASGKGGAIATLTQRLDPRGFKLHPIHDPNEVEHNYPWLWRFWQQVPNRGEMAIFDRSWYSRVLADRVENLVTEDEWRAAYSDINDFERMHAADGTVIVKFFLHIGKKEQSRRFDKLAANPLEAWRVTKQDRARHKKYDQYAEAIEDMLELSEAEYAPWTIVEAASRHWARKKILETIVRALEHRLGSNTPHDASGESLAREADLRAAMDSIEPQTDSHEVTL